MKKFLLATATLFIVTAVSAQVNAVRFFSTETNTPLAARTTQANIDIDGDTFTDDSRVFFGFNDPEASAWSSNSVGTYPYALFGGFMGESLNNPSRNTGAYSLGAGGFDLRYQPDSTGETGRVTMALVFEASQSGLAFDANSYLRIGGGTTWQTDASLARVENLGQTRWLVRNGLTYYVSETQFANSVDGRLLTGAEIAATNWAIYDPTAAFAFNQSLTFDVASSSLTDLNAFGVATYKPTLDNTRSWLQFTQFEAVTAIPEPGTLALVGIALGSLLFFRRRR